MPVNHHEILIALITPNFLLLVYRSDLVGCRTDSGALDRVQLVEKFPTMCHEHCICLRLEVVDSEDFVYQC